MKYFEIIKHRPVNSGLNLICVWFIIAIIGFLPGISGAETGWSVNSSFQMTRGDFNTGNTTTYYYVTIGSRYRTETWYISANFSLVTQDGLFLENEVSNMMGTTSTSHMNTGIGDIYIYGEVTLLQGTSIVPWISLSSQIKFPTASSSNYFGTGEFDYGAGITFRKQISSFIVFGDIGYLNLGDPENITFLNPVAYGIGIGRGFEYGTYSISLYYQRYTKIYEGISPPEQISLGFYSGILNNTFISVIGSKGMSETSPDFSFSTGLEYYF